MLGSPAFHDVECTRPYGRKCFAWIRPGPGGQRIAQLLEWHDPGVEQIPVRKTRHRRIPSHLARAHAPSDP